MAIARKCGEDNRVAKSSIKIPCEVVVIGSRRGETAGRRPGVPRRRSKRKNVVTASLHSCSESTVIALPDGSTMTVVGFIEDFFVSVSLSGSPLAMHTQQTYPYRG